MKKSNKRLGRGLSGLMRGSGVQPAQETDAVSVVNLPVDSIENNPAQPRKDFNHEKLEELSLSIKNNGILQPLIIAGSKNAKTGMYTLVAGERRLKAAAIAGIDTVPCIIREANDRQMREWSIMENIQRADLNPMERAEAYNEYINRFGVTQEEISEKLGIPRSSITNHLRLLELETETKKLITEGKLSFGHAKILASLTGEKNRQVALAKKTAREALSVRALEKALAREDGKKLDKQDNKTPVYITDMENQLTEASGTRVKLKPGKKKNTGRIVIEYYSLDDFDRITQVIGLKEH